MKYKLELPIKVGDLIYTIEDCKIEEYYVEGFKFSKLPEIAKDISHCTMVYVEKYKEPENSFKTTIPLSHCFLSKEELLKQL